MEELVIKGDWVSPLPASPKKRGKRRGRSSDRKREMGGGEGSGSPALFPTCFEIGVLEVDGGEPRMQGTQEPNTIPASWVGEMEGSGGASGVESESLQEEMEQGNIRGIREDVKRRAVLGYLEGVGFDVCFIQEVHLRDSGDVIRFKREWDKGESLAAGRREMVDCLAPLCATNRHLVIGGDFNIDIGRGRDSSAGAIAGLMVVPWSGRWGPAHCSDDGRSNMAQLQRGRAEARLYFSGRLLPVFFWGDHDGVLLQVGAPVCLFGRGGLEGIRSICEGVLEWWEIGKVRIRVFIIGYCKRKKREERREVDHIKRLLNLELEAGNLGGSVDWERSSALKAQFREVHERKARAFLERAHSGFLEHDETCSAVFFKSVRGRQSRKVMYGVREENGRVLRETEEMVKVTTEHF
ncbi:unnamed protein product [Coregonus sp. 'balchen']|nr:unnamed protein product [Coregonus sp. 'balchen']